MTRGRAALGDVDLPEWRCFEVKEDALIDPFNLHLLVFALWLREKEGEPCGCCSCGKEGWREVIGGGRNFFGRIE